MNLCVRRCLPASRPRADSDCTPASPTRSSGSIPVPSTSAPERSRTISSRQDRSLTAGRLVRYLTLAGKSALEAAAFEEARRSFRSALSHQGAVDLRERADLLASLAMAERGLEQWDAAIANLREALEIYINLGDREMIGRSFTELTDAFIWAGRFQEATETARRGLAYLEADVSADRVRLLAALGSPAQPPQAMSRPTRRCGKR